MALDCWGRLEVMGHLTFYGKLSEEEIAGMLMVRVDFTERDEAKIRYFGTASIYSIEPLTEDAVIEATTVRPRRISPYVESFEEDRGRDDFDDDDEEGM